jgi:hypothetical protein
MINLNRPTCDDDAIVRQSRIVAFDAIARRAPREPAPTPYEVAVYAFECEDHSAQESAKPADAVSHQPGDPPMGTLADMIADCAPVSGAALVGTKPQADAETWHTEAPTVAGVYIAQDIPVDAGRTYYMRFHGSEGWGAHHDTIEDAAEEEDGWGESRPIVWLRLVRPDHPAAKPASIPGWRRGPDVPESERKSGLWFYRLLGDMRSVGYAVTGLSRSWDRGCEYRPAPPGVKEGDAYSPALYGEEV